MNKEVRKFTAELTDIDLNYIDAALANEIRERELILERYGKDHGNYAVLVRQAKRTRAKLRRVHYPPNGKPKLTPQVRRIVREVRGKVKRERP